MAAPTKIRLESFNVQFHTASGNFLALRDLNLDVRVGEFVVLIGPSGCGKSTLLNALAGLLDQRTTSVTGNVQISHRTNGQDKSLGYVFQRDALLPWRTVKENVEIGLEIRGVTAMERARIVDDWIARVGLRGFEKLLPHQLSGGMRQRVALIRTLAYAPDVVLMDEPFGALDSQSRIVLQDELLKLWSSERQTILFVTHDLGEAITLGDRVVLLSKRPGRVEAEYTIDLPRPRSALELRLNPRFDELHHQIWSRLSREVTRLAEDLPQSLF